MWQPPMSRRNSDSRPMSVPKSVPECGDVSQAMSPQPADPDPSGGAVPSCLGAPEASPAPPAHRRASPSRVGRGNLAGIVRRARQLSHRAGWVGSSRRVAAEEPARRESSRARCGSRDDGQAPTKKAEVAGTHCGAAGASDKAPLHRGAPRRIWRSNSTTNDPLFSIDTHMLPHESSEDPPF